jgi:CubicO group peptidase (beta-lactamase class C family)
MRIGTRCLAGAAVVAVVAIGFVSALAASDHTLDELRRASRTAPGTAPDAARVRAGDTFDAPDMPSAAALARVDRQAAPPATLDELRDTITKIMQQYEVPGVGLALIDHGRVEWAGGVGLADRERGVPVTADTMFRVGSLTKTFIVLALMRLVERGRLSLDTPVSSIAPEIAFTNRWESEQPITIAHLLEHTSGFDEMRPNETFAPPEAETQSLYDVLARNPASRVARWRPGSRGAYSNPGYTLAAYILEKVTGQPYEQVIARELFQPLGMPHAALRLTPDARARLAQGYDERDRPAEFRHIYHRPAGNLMISARELASLVQLALARGRVGDTAIVSPATWDRMERSGTVDLDSGDASYGLGNWGDVSPRIVLRGHGGYMPGFLAMYGYSASRGIGYVLLMNATKRTMHDARFEIRSAIIEYLVRDQAVPPPPRVQVPEAELARWVGVYHFSAPRFQLMAFRDRMEPSIELYLRDGRLYTRPIRGDEPERELIPTGGGRFRSAWSSGSYAALGHDRDGERIYIAGNDYFVEEPRWLALLFAFGPGVCLTLLASGLLLPLSALRRRADPSPGIAWPVSVTASLLLAPHLFGGAIERGTLGECNVFTMALFALSLVFAVGSIATAIQTLRWLPRPGSALGKLHRALFSLAACCATGYLAAFGMIGIRMWRF